MCQCNLNEGLAYNTQEVYTVIGNGVDIRLRYSQNSKSALEVFIDNLVCRSSVLTESTHAFTDARIESMRPSNPALGTVQFAYNAPAHPFTPNFPVLPPNTVLSPSRSSVAIWYSTGALPSNPVTPSQAATYLYNTSEQYHTRLLQLRDNSNADQSQLMSMIGATLWNPFNTTWYPYPNVSHHHMQDAQFRKHRLDMFLILDQAVTMLMKRLYLAFENNIANGRPALWSDAAVHAELIQAFVSIRHIILNSGPCRLEEWAVQSNMA